MNHKWSNKYTKHELTSQDCKTCGCTRTPIYYRGKLLSYLYERSSIHYQHRPDCIDWELENSKTID